MQKSFDYKFLVEIFTDIFESIEPINQKILITKYGQERYNLFSYYFLGGIEKYVMMVHEKDEILLKLTQEGLNYFLNLKQNYTSQMISGLNLKASLGAVTLVLCNFLLEKVPPSPDKGWLLFLLYLLSIVFLVLFAIFVITSAVGDYISLKK